jgi:hypothetical protein
MRPKLLEYREEECYNPEHQHEVPLQRMARIQVGDREFDVTLDGERCNVRADDWRETIGVRIQDAIAFITGCLLEEGDADV